MAPHAQERVLDVSLLEPPEPLERALAAVEFLRPGEYLRMLHRREPCMLYPKLERMGYSHLTWPGRQTAFEVVIWRTGDARAESAARRARTTR
jgi:hypothetical protein